MMTDVLFRTRNIVQERKLLLLFMVCWFIVNCLQASFLGLDGDEAYYWVLSQNISWGYFDHPPLAPLLINIGESIAHGSLFTRLATIILSTLTIPLVYGALPGRLQNIKWFVILYASTLIFNVYGFITTPDAPLFFFSALFFYGYKQFLKTQNIGNTLIMAVAVTGMFYSKYHGILPVIFVVLSNIRLLKNKYFWLMVILVTVLFLPHLYWQYQYNWPTVRYHLVERLSKTYRISFTTDYILGQLLIWGPLISLLFFFRILSTRIQGKLTRAHVFNFSGVLLFFAVSSFKNTVEPHWTLIAGVSYIVLFLNIVQKSNHRFRKGLLRVAYVNIGLILLARILFLLPHSPFQILKHFSPFFWGKEWAAQVNTMANGKPVIFTNSYAMPALYNFYNPHSAAYGYSTKQYRKTNYSIGLQDCIYDGQQVLIFSSKPLGSDTLRKVQSKYRSGYLLPITYKCINALRIKAITLPKLYQSGETLPAVIEITNTGNMPINAATVKIDYAFFIAKFEFINSKESYLLPDTVIPPGYTKKLQVQITAPYEPGDYKILFSFANGILPGNFASDFYDVEIVANNK
ncbi:MAG: glycosyltransferase family 39 protein [Niabella sp.]